MSGNWLLSVGFDLKLWYALVGFDSGSGIISHNTHSQGVYFEIFHNSPRQIGIISIRCHDTLLMNGQNIYHTIPGPELSGHLCARTHNTSQWEGIKSWNLTWWMRLIIIPFHLWILWVIMHLSTVISRASYTIIILHRG